MIAKGDYKITTKIAVVNAKCPITGGALSPDGVVENLTRDHKGRKIGFCCDGCPEEWDKLTDADKDAELAKAKKRAK